MCLFLGKTNLVKAKLKMKNPSQKQASSLPRSLFAILLAALLVMSVSVYVGKVPQTSAQPTCVGSWDNLHWVEGGGVQGGSYTNAGESAVAEFDWKVPNTAKAGDKLTFTLPPQLQVATGADQRFTLRDASNREVGTAEWSGKNLIVTLSDFAGTHFDVQGKVKVSLQWDRSQINTETGYDSAVDGLLQFSGCGQGALAGVYPKDGPGGNTHETSKAGQYRGKKTVDEADIYLTDWTVWINGSTKGTETAEGGFRVTDKAPEGHKFACDSAMTSPSDVVSVGTWSNDFFYLGSIINANNYADGGRYVGFTGIQNTFTGHNFTVTCSEQEIVFEFPYGLSPQTGPIVRFTTYTETKPEAFSTQTNTATVNGKDYTGYAAIPGSGGFGTGKLGGFTVRKVVIGSGVNIPSEFTFEYKCEQMDGSKIVSEEFKVKGDGTDYRHFTSLEKGMSCEVKEKNDQLGSPEPRLSWIIDGQPAASATFTIRDPKENSVDLIATNTYPEDPKEETGSFIIEKQLVGDPAIVDGLKDKEFNFTYSCNDEVSQKVKASVNKPFTSEKEYPVGTKCVIKELEEGTDVEQHIWSHTLTPNDGIITIGKEQTAKVIATNIYTPVPKGTFTVKKVVEGDAKVATDPQYQSKEFSGEYKCGSSEWTPFKVSAEKPFVSPEFLENTECEVKELDTDAAISGYEWTSSVENGKFTIGKDKKQSIDVKFINTYKPKLGGFFLEKIVNGPAAGLAKDLEYSFNYVCGEKTGPFTVKAGEIISGPIDIPVGTRCKVTEASFDSPRGTTWTGSITKNGEFTIEEDKTAQITATNTFDYSDGGFAISKTVGGDAKDLAKLAELPFEFKYSCKAPTGGNAIDGSVSVMNGQTKHIEKIPVGSECEVTESDIRHDGVDWSVTLSGEDISVNGATAKFKVPSEDAPALLVKAHNTFTQQKGSFKINKIVDAEAGVAVPKEFGFAWTCGNLSGEATVPVVNGRGSVAVSEEIAIGTECVISEKDASIPGASLATTWENQRFVIGEKDQVVSVTATNTYKAHTGGFVIRKQLVGAASDKAKEKVFTFDYVCTKRDKETARGILNIKGEGSSDPVSDIADGSECTITERDAHIDGTNWNHTISNDGKISIIGGNPTITVSAVNGYEKPPLSPLVPLIPLIPLIPLLPFVITPIIPPTSSVPPQIAPQAPAPQQPNKAQVNKQRTPLAKTGASVIGLGFASALLIAAGVFIIRRGKKKN